MPAISCDTTVARGGPSRLNPTLPYDLLGISSVQIAPFFADPLICVGGYPDARERLLRHGLGAGVDAILVTGEGRWLVTAMALLPIALVFDFADGRVARWRHRSSALGADLDSLADVISFGLAPAALGFAVGLRGTLDIAILLYFVACGISRLARFNATADDLADATGKVRYFEGTPIPTSLLLVAVLAVLYATSRIGLDLWLGRWSILGLGLHPLAILYVISGSFMISTIRVPKL